MTRPPEEPQSKRQASGEYRPSYGAGAQPPSFADPQSQGTRAENVGVEEQPPRSSAEETPHGGRPRRKRLFVAAALVAVLALVGGVGGLIYYSNQTKGGVTTGDLAAASSSAAAASSSAAEASASATYTATREDMAKRIRRAEAAARTACASYQKHLNQHGYWEPCRASAAAAEGIPKGCLFMPDSMVDECTRQAIREGRGVTTTPAR